jgi:hypothetical protein
MSVNMGWGWAYLPQLDATELHRVPLHQPPTTRNPAHPVIPAGDMDFGDLGVYAGSAIYLEERNSPEGCRSGDATAASRIRVCILAPSGR